MPKRKNNHNQGILISGGIISANSIAAGPQARATHIADVQNDTVGLREVKDDDVSRMDLFISHSSKDEKIVKRLITLVTSAFNLPSASIRCTSVDGYRLRAGGSVAEQLRQETQTARLFIAVITPSSLSSKYVLFELGARWGSGKPLFPVVAAGADESCLEGPLSAINVLSCDSQAQVHQLVDDIGAVLGRRPDRVAAYQKCISELVEESLMARNQQADESR